MKIPRHIFVILLFVLILTGCELFTNFSDPEEALDGSDNVTIAFAEPISNYSPLSYEAKDRKYLANIYESLVRYDKTFNYDTSLAVSWGRLDDVTWDFRLREGVIFHDGSEFNADDAVYSIELAMNDADSELGSLLSGIVSVKKIDDYRLEIVTDEPDPLFLNKMVYVYMLSDGYEDFNSPLGTGPYVVTGFSENTLELASFEYYWDDLPYFSDISLKYIASSDERVQALLNGDVQFLANVPPQDVEELVANDINVIDFPSLEVSFLMFNQESVFKDENLRLAVWNVLGTQYAELFGSGYLKSSNQIAASGINGYITETEARQKNLVKANEYMDEYGRDELAVTLDVPLGLDVLGNQIAEDMAEINIDVTVNVLSPTEFEKKILNGESEFYFFGWKYDLADVSDFYEAVLHSPDGEYGTFNGLNYYNEEVDSLIEESRVTLDVVDRQAILKQVAVDVLEEKYVLPLFEAKLLYGLNSELDWDIRLDGQIVASEISENVVK